MESYVWKCLTALSGWCLLISFCAIVNGLSQSPPSNPLIYIDIPRWENRSSVPRFLHFRDELRRNGDAESDSSQVVFTPTKRDANGLPTNIGTINFRKSVRNNVGDDAQDSLDELPPEGNGIPTGNSNGDYVNGKRVKDVNKGVSRSAPAKYSSTVKENADEGATNAQSELSDENKQTQQNSQEKLVFPSVITNPCNRLQIQRETHETDDKTNQSAHVPSANESSPGPDPFMSQGPPLDSLEVGDRNGFQSSVIQKDGVQSFDLTMNIIRLSKWTDQNIIFSPLSIANVLAMLMLGSGGDTFDELTTYLAKQTLGNGVDKNSYHSSFQQLLRFLPQNSGNDVTLSIASEIFVQKSYPVSTEFRKDLAKYYSAPIESVDFVLEGEQFKNRLNEWVREKTQNKIKTILEKSPDASTVMGIVNAIYFKGPWEVPFNERVTKWKDFRVTPKETTKVQMMLNILHVPFVERDGYKLVGLPYRDNQTGLFVILPKGNDGISDLTNVEKVLTRQELNHSLSSMITSKVLINLPKLKFSSDGQMRNVLEEMGLSSMFYPNSANFTGISDKNLYISFLLHRAVVEINERGTEASAVTYGAGDRIFDEPPIPFACDKPFIFFIYHIKADTILFWGRVTRPNLTS